MPKHSEAVSSKSKDQYEFVVCGKPGVFKENLLARFQSLGFSMKLLEHAGNTPERQTLIIVEDQLKHYERDEAFIDRSKTYERVIYLHGSLEKAHQKIQNWNYVLKPGSRRCLEQALDEKTRPAFEAEQKSEHKAHVLVADDNLVNQRVLCAFLGKWGVTSDTADDGREALERLQEAHYDLVFMDCQMPELNGLDATREFRSQTSSLNQDVPIIALTARVSREDEDLCLDAGMNAYLTKPLNKEAMKSVMNFWLADKGSL